MSPAALAPIPLRAPGLAGALGASFERYGFAVVSDPGLDAGQIAAAEADAKAFFALPSEIKARHRVAGGAGQRGYTPLAVETAKGAAAADLKEFWHVGREGNLWPEEIADFQAHMLALYGAQEELGMVLMGAIGAHLSLAPGYLEGACAGGDSILRLLHYPPTQAGKGGVRAGAHEDINAITLLLGAEEAGLEILTREGAWLAVAPPPGAVVVNIGDMLARLTNDVLPSTTHRVANPAPGRRGVARYSMPFFLHFRGDFRIETLPGCVSPARPDGYPSSITARAFLEQRLREIRLA